MKAENPLPNDWTLSDGHGYILNRDRSHAAASRLNLQYYLWKSALGYTIHPSILRSLPPSPLIADVACGTCLWLIDVSHQHPTAHLDGFDLDLRQAPHKNWLPQNINVHYCDILADVRDHAVAKYDYIHTRLLVLVVRNQDPKPVLRNLYKMLKPGGYLQWDELDTFNACVRKVSPTLKTPALDQLREWSWAEGRHDWTVRLADFLTEEGFVDVKTDFVKEGEELARAFGEQHLLTAEEFAEGLVKVGQREAAGKYFRLVGEAEEESVRGAALCVPRVVCVARKPL
ncbi:hypothetical protein XANCAGTX0491_006793 [Xanthoria calcicola]